MDRRRFVPFGENLEGRELLSLFGGTTNNYKKNSDQNVPITWYMKEQRVDHLPFYLDKIDTGRFLPATTVHHLQADLNNVLGTLHSPNESPVQNFDLALRDAYSHASISTAEAQRLNRAFGSVLVAAGATAQQTINLQGDLNQLIYIDSKSVNPVNLAANDYSLVLQTALAVGRPIKPTEPPVLHTNDGVVLTGGKLGRTSDHTPTLVGNYPIGGKAATITDVQIVTADGTVLAAGSVDKTTNNYSAKITTPLPDGIYNLYSRAIDNQGHMSDISYHYFELKVVTPPRDRVTHTTTVTTANDPLKALEGK